MVLRHPHSLNPMAAHTIDQWFGHEKLQAEVEVDEPRFEPEKGRDPGLISTNADPGPCKPRRSSMLKKTTDGQLVQHS